MLEVIVRSVTAPAPAMIYAPTLLDYKYKSGKFVYGRSHVKLRNRCPSSAAHQLLQHSRRFITCFITNLIIYCTINISRRFGSLRFFFFFFFCAKLLLSFAMKLFGYIRKLWGFCELKFRRSQMFGWKKSRTIVKKSRELVLILPLV